MKSTYGCSPSLSDFLQKAEAMNQPLEVAVINGVNPFMASVIKAPTGVNKFEMAGGLVQRPVEMIRCKTVNLEVPANAEFALEGKILSHKKEKDGPFGGEDFALLNFMNGTELKREAKRKSSLIKNR